MFKGSLTKNHVGINITGDYYDFECLYDTLLAVTDDYEEGRLENTLFMALAYDVRKAMEGRRNRIDVSPDSFFPIPITYFSTEYIIPDLLITISLLRRVMAYRINSHSEQSIVFAMENICLQTLLINSKKHGLEIFNWTQRFDIRQEEYALELLSMATHDFLYLSKDQRIPQLIKTLEKHFITNRKDSILFLESEAKRLNTDISKLTSNWPEFNW